MVLGQCVTRDLLTHLDSDLVSDDPPSMTHICLVGTLHRPSFHNTHVNALVKPRRRWSLSHIHETFYVWLPFADDPDW